MAQYPIILAGMRLTADLLNSMMPLHARKTTTTSRASTIALATDPELQVAVEANAEYTFHAYIRCSGVVAGGISLQFSGPAGSTGSWGARTINTGEISSAGLSSQVRTSIGAPKDFEVISTTAAQTVMPVGRLYTAGTAGIFSLDWAQDDSSATATAVEADSWFELRRIA
ncbi:hypothetical protein HRW07_10230 [Streptomyces lunaelactis]|uniref:hypothetical protein n=1 Tax=Streptomyces lunaelactis TaxID=1535768 RepID=UPI0015855FB7|nr:hypothetical protein [Streptomyces lunaelactis]NUL03606.1 hypothetical protein [Streptomyces lunaelactis]